MATSPRSKRVSMSLTEAEHQAWSAAAGDQPLSTWARHQVQAQLETDSAADGVGGSEIQRLRADLGRVGSNVNQLTRGMHQGQLTDTEELVAALDQVSQHLAAVRRALP
ncbi:MAG TPA: plasmid mobilization relaxosome protein MobC [Beutenbergiaceae bacterium]|nr:plasmid mobilization relaxosome protein MobC [Beutenbergiaceae bacterium]